MRRWAIHGMAAAALAALAPPAAAETGGPLPALHDVTGVAAGGTLPLRAGPRPAGEAVGALPADARGVEVLAVEPGPMGTRWARVALPEGDAWVEARFLARREDEGDWLPPVACIGTEPFWTFELGAGEIAGLAFPGAKAAPVFVTRRTRSANDPRSHGLTARWDGPEGDPATFGITGAPVAGVLRRAACSDGMSDRPYGIAIDLLLGTLGPDGRADTAHLGGCCRLDP